MRKNLMKKSIYLLVILVSLGFNGCSSKPDMLKDISQKTCKINGGSPRMGLQHLGHAFWGLELYGLPSKYCESVTYTDAKEICNDVGGRVATVADLNKIAIDCGANLTLTGRERIKEDRRTGFIKKYKKCMQSKYKEKYFRTRENWTSSIASESKVYTWSAAKNGTIKKGIKGINDGSKASVTCINPVAD